MTQAPTPGPLSDAERYEQAKRDFNRMRDDGSLPECDGCDASHRCMGVGNVCNPTAPVEASGSFEERALMLTKKHGNPVGTDYEQGQNDMGHRLVTMAREADAAIAALRPQPSGFLATLTDEQRGEALAYTGDDTHPQMSGETREAVARLAWTYACSSDELDPQYDNGWLRALDLYANEPRYTDSAKAFVDRTWAFADAILALLSDRPLALGGQQGEECRGCGHVGPVPKDRIACCPDGKRYDTTPVRAEAPSEDDARRRLIQRIEQWDGEMEYDAEDIAALADDILHEFNGAPVVARAEAQDEGAAGYLVALLASYCGDDTSGCTDETPCLDCVRMANVYKIPKTALGEFVGELGNIAASSPTPAADEDRVRELEAALETIVGDGEPPERGNGNTNDLLAAEFWNIANRALKSTAAKEGGEG